MSWQIVTMIGYGVVAMAILYYRFFLAPRGFAASKRWRFVLHPLIFGCLIALFDAALTWDTTPNTIFMIVLAPIVEAVLPCILLAVARKFFPGFYNRAARLVVED